MNKAIFLDRDGTIIEDKSYMYHVEDLILLDNVVEALRKFKDMGYLLIVITNQSGIGRGYFTMQQAESFHKAFVELLKEKGCTIDATYTCPHAPEEGCACRKPSPLLVQRAIQDWQINPNESYMFGDKETDVLCGSNAGVKSYKVSAQNNLLYWANKIERHEI
ncbi:MAG: HAD family hydrolase [Paludibacteraceae bacterium]|nr:HAD family hydrolase [Paludibacteraceae bacterium]